MRKASIQPVALPSLPQHLREFAARRDAWMILARNLVPVVGIYLFDWSAALTVFNYWFDGLSAMAAIIAALVPRAMRESLPAAGGTVGRRNQVFGGVFVWAFLSAIVGLPYWIALIPLHDVLLGQTLHRQLAESPSLWLTFALMAAMHFWKAFHAGYGSMPEQELKQRARADVYLLFVRGIAMFIMAAQGFAFVLVPLMALLLSYFEIWPERVMRGAFDDPGENRSRDPADD